MKFAIENADELYWHFEKELHAGKKWFTYEDEIIKRPYQVVCFSSQFNADQYAHDNTSGWDFVFTAPITDAKFHLKNILGTERTNELIVNVENHLNGKFMNNQNFEYLQSNLKYFGFGEKLNETLEINIQEQKKEFQLKLEIPHFNNKMDYTLHFKKSDTTDMYFFNRYDANLQNGKPEQDRNQSFYVNKGNGVTAKEAFNLLEGRSVFKDLLNKDGEKYSAWLKLDFENKDDKGNFKLKQFSEQYGFNLEKTLSNYPIKEMDNPDQKTMLLNSLQKGNAQQVTIAKEGKDSRYYIEAVPQFKNINVYDHKMHPVKRQNMQKESTGNGESVMKVLKPSKKQEQKSEAEDGRPSQKQPRKRKLSV